mgnify:FL=1
MSTKTISMQEANLISWFNGQINVIESQSKGLRVEKLTLSVDRTVSNDISILLQYAPVEEPPAE